MAGSMANEISSTDMVIAFGKEGFLASYGSGGVSISKVEEAILKIKEALPQGPYCFNLIHSPQEGDLEKNIVDLYLKHNVTVIEASAFINLTASLVYYRLAGLSKDISGNITIKNKIIAKISRDKIARRFMEPAPKKFIDKLLEQNLITQEQAELAKFVPMADDVTVEADSGGHTDNRPMVSIFTVIRSLRDEVQSQFNYTKKIRIGLGGGISTPESLLAAFVMGADYVVTGSINQSCVEAGTSVEVKKILAEAEVTDVDMAPAADMFEMGVRVQVLKKNTLYPIRAQKLYDIYTRFESIDDIPKEEKEKIEKQILQKTMEEVWQETVDFFTKRNDLEQIEKANNDPKKKMALIFRWYLGLSPYWARKAVAERKMDYQIWCGPSMGAFNNWVKGTELEKPENRFVADIANRIMKSATYLFRLNYLKSLGVEIDS
jgi:PfaD family protein